ncbi:NADPH-dependent FMN reductase [Thermococcus aciditolerans]|uniref:NADPH-dependent FMN reductase n=1 Tax=Thermococcus aciditolerans TaxID=2598455 RepID=UPI001FE609F1|nr:NAD(P)H-dependent oxidoreductase [Thermococcus aciditolerans]
MKVKIILGTAREGRKSERVAGYLVKKAEEPGWEAEMIDVRATLSLHAPLENNARDGEVQG